MRYYAFPDIHGCMDIFQKALDFVYRENTSGGKIIFLGDYIDRGPKNKEVIETVMNPPENWEFIALAGNHEQMFLDAFYSDYVDFFDYNVLKEYYGPGTDYPVTKQDHIKLMPAEVIEWMKKLKLTHIEDKNVFAHAYYNPHLKQEEQNSELVLWNRMDDHQKFDSRGYFLTHGHTPRKYGPCFAPQRVNLDCGVHHYGQYAIGEYEKDTLGPVNIHAFTV